MKILITGGAGFVGSSLAKQFIQHSPSDSVHVIDNLKRRGSELNLPVFRELGIAFTHGDIRNAGDLQELAGDFDVMLECSAEPSVLAGANGSPGYLLDTNLVGTLRCLEFARHRVGRMVFLSTSRIYALQALQELPLREMESRFELEATRAIGPGVTANGLTEEFPCLTARSLYGATKLASEMLIQEYAYAYGLRALINRCGVIAGPGQFGKVDQGVFTLWVARHHFGLPLKYTGYGGTGKQVRDLLHPNDLFALIVAQLASDRGWNADVFNVGGGREISVSMRELTAHCQRLTGRTVEITADATTHPYDIPLYLSDSEKAGRVFGWKPKLGVESILGDIADWIVANEAMVRPVFC